MNTLNVHSINVQILHLNAISGSEAVGEQAQVHMN